MEKKIVKIGMIIVLAFALIISSFGALNLGYTPEKYEIGAEEHQTGEIAGGGAFLSLKTAL